MKRPGWIQTYTGKPFYFDNIDSNEICIEDIAHALSNICRFGGHTPFHYSVAQHSLLVSRLVPREYALEALLHDATEAYIGDMVTPLKRRIPEFSGYEAELSKKISRVFGLRNIGDFGINGMLWSEEIHKADLEALAIEAKFVMGADLEDWGLDPVTNTQMRRMVRPRTQKEAKEDFLNRFKEIVEQRESPNLRGLVGAIDHKTRWGGFEFIANKNGTIYPAGTEDAKAFEAAFKPAEFEKLFPNATKSAYLDCGVNASSPPAPKNILQEAESLVTGARAEAYGHPAEDFSRTAKMWSAILGVEVPVEKIALCMIALKVSRQCNAAKRDNWTDIAGYAQTGYMVNQKQGKME